jgi:hypothetical protein
LKVIEVVKQVAGADVAAAAERVDRLLHVHGLARPVPSSFVAPVMLSWMIIRPIAHMSHATR